MKKVITLGIIYLLMLPLKAEELPSCKWNNSDGIPCVTIFSAPNTSKISEGSLGKTIITKTINWVWL